jgi:hypothetical protein
MARAVVEWAAGSKAGAWVEDFEDRASAAGISSGSHIADFPLLSN